MWDLLIIGLYLFSTLVIGIYSGRRIKGMKDFAIAERKYTTPVIVATIAATSIGGASTLGITQRVFSIGFIYVFVFMGETIHNLLVAQFVAPRMKPFLGMISVGDMMGHFYEKPGKLITGIAGSLVSIGIVGAQVSAMGYLLHLFLDISHFYGILLGAGIVVFYSTFGGVKAVTATDVIQFIVLIVAIPMVCNVGLSSVGGYSGLWEKLPESHHQLLPEGENLFKYIALFIVFTIPFLKPAMTQRMLMAQDPKQIRQSLRLTAMIEVPFYIIAGFIGLVALVTEPSLESHLALPYLINTILPPGIKGLAIAGMLAVIMSTADSYLNAGSIMLIHDVVKPLKKDQLTDDQELRLTRIATLVLGFFAIAAAVSFKGIIDILLNFLNFWGPVVVIPLFAGIFGVRTKPIAFVMSACAGVLTFAFWMIFGLEARLGFESLVPSMAANALVFFVVCKVSRAN